MKVLVATKETQGKSSRDFYWCEEGELVYFGFECCNRTSCGCSWSFNGMRSRKGTTTARVVDMSISKGELVAEMMESHKKSFPSMDLKTLKKGSLEDVEIMLKVAENFDAGAIVERAHNTVVERDWIPNT